MPTTPAPHRDCDARRAPLRADETKLWHAAAVAVVALVGGGCDGAPSTISPPPPAPPHDAFDSIPSTPLQGKLRGVAFSVNDARYRIDRRAGYETVDILLSAGGAEQHCGELAPNDSPSVWLRRKGATPIEAVELHIDPNRQAAWELHYQMREQEQWVGSSNAAALLRLRPAPHSSSIGGELSACFGDGHRSCVNGTFSARQCPVRLDMPVRGNEPVEQLPLNRPPPDAGSD